MDGAEFVPKDTVAILALRQNRSAAGHLTVIRNEPPGVRPDIIGNGFNIRFRHKCSPLSSTAFAAFFTIENLCIHFSLLTG